MQPHVKSLLLCLLLIAVVSPTDRVALASEPAAEEAGSQGSEVAPSGGKRVLLPTAAPHLSAAFAKAAPDWRLDSAQIDKDRVAARVCSGDECHRLALTDGQGACDGAIVGAWCATWPEGEPETTASLYEALGSAPDAAFWHTIAPKPAHGTRQPPASEEETRSGDPTSQPDHDAVHGGTPHHGAQAAAGQTTLKTREVPRAGYGNWFIWMMLVSIAGFAIIGGLRWMGVGRRRKAKRRGNPGRIATIWLAPHAVMGLWLILVPDTVTFTANQVVLLVHVVLSLVTLPIVVWYTGVHLVKTWNALTGPGHDGTIGKHGTTIAIVGAIVSGIVVLWYGQGMPAGTWHLWFGIAACVMVVIHLWTLSLRNLTYVSVGILAGAAAIAGITVLVMPHEPWEPDKPEFAYAERDVDLYDSAEWCGSCHAEFYDEWKRSVHGSTFKGHDVQTEQRPFQEKRFFEFGLVEAGRVARGERGPEGNDVDPPAEYATCSHCHSPTLYYSNAKEGPFDAPAPVSDGVTCSFCHTVRDIRNDGKDLTPAMPEGKPISPEGLILAKAFQLAPFYVSAPESVRRYIGQNSKNPVARKIGDYLINWWPEMHRRDYHSEILDTSELCQGCHGFGLNATIHGTYVDWKDSEFAKRDPQVRCQDCHMVREMTGDPVTESGRHVAWGPVRPRRTYHLLAGGNANWSEKYADAETAAFQRKWNSKSMEVEVLRAQREDDAVELTVQVRTPLVGHNFPSMETVMRYGYVNVQGLGDDGSVVTSTRPWPGGHSLEDPREKDVVDPRPRGPLIYRYEGWPHDGSEDTLIPADGKRDFVVRLPAEGTAHDVVRLAVQLYNSWDSQPVATTEFELPGRRDSGDARLQ